MSDIPKYDEILKKYNVLTDRPMFNDIYQQGRADAIDDFLKEMKREIHIESYFVDRNFKNTIEDIAKGLTR